MSKITTALKAIRQTCISCSETRKLLAQCPCNGVDSERCALWPLRFGIRPQTALKRYRKWIPNPELMKPIAPLRAIRHYCLSCAGGNGKCVAYCTCDGVNSTFCSLWRFRFGVRPGTAIQKFGELIMTPTSMPDADVCLHGLPASPAQWKPSSPGQSTADRIPESTLLADEGDEF